ncbi:MAG TPA: PD-(D/E)XK nuclease family protein [Bryobacteraceae bacterium]|nr:PD-(D/E)XK nuclease family protein [Bryobacteraceae bacterium]
MEAFRGQTGACLLTPTATLAEHIRHSLARRGQLVRPDSIVTLSRFLEPLLEGIPAATTAMIGYLVSQELLHRPPALFRPLSRSRGLRRSLTSLIEEVGQIPRRCPPGATPAAEAFFAIFDSVQQQLSSRGCLLRPERLRRAAQRLRAVPAAWKPVCLTGFYAFTPAELEILDALKPAGVVLSLPGWEGAQDSREALRSLGFLESTIPDSIPAAETTVAAAPGEQQEAEDIARQILQYVQRGAYTFRDIGILVRREHPYVPLLRTTLERYLIPATYFFQRALHKHPLARYFLTFLEALSSGWDYQRTLPLLQMPLSGLTGEPEVDQLDRLMRERLPARGIPAALDALGWQRFSRWTTTVHTPAEWAAELGALKQIVRMPVITDNVRHGQVIAWRELAAALQAWDEALAQTAALPHPDVPIPLAEFQSLLADVLEHVPVSSRDLRRNAVHVLDVHEARQWRIPVVFLCGMLERGFPQYHSEHPILADSDRQLLRSEGILLRTSGERQREESFLFDTAAQAATERLSLSYPRANAKGEETLPSFLLTSIARKRPVTSAFFQPARPRPLWPKAPRPQPGISHPELRAALKQARASLSPTAVETFLQCPFQFFARYVLKLKPSPPRPQERLDFLLQGNILHQTLAEASGSPLFVEEIFTRLFADACREKSVPAGCVTEKARLELHYNLRRFLESPPLAGASTRSVERGFDIRVSQDLRLRGKMDRVVDLPQRGLVVIDYKYSTPERIRGNIRAHDRGELVQGGLYLWAAEKLYRSEPAGMLYCGLRSEVSWAGWHLPLSGWQDIGESWEQPRIREMIDKAIEASLIVAGRIANGDTTPRPADEKKCVWCDFKDACRIESQPAPLVQVAGGKS